MNDAAADVFSVVVVDLCFSEAEKMFIYLKKYR
jgi:hypothetical protein